MLKRRWPADGRSIQFSVRRIRASRWRLVRPWPWPKWGTTCRFASIAKEAKDHGEGGLIVGAPLKGNVLIVDDVITDGASKRESLNIIRAAGATPVGVLIALDRQERGAARGSTLSAAQEFRQTTGVPVNAVATVADLMRYLEQLPDEGDKLGKIEAYRQRYRASGTFRGRHQGPKIPRLPTSFFQSFALMNTRNSIPPVAILAITAACRPTPFTKCTDDKGVTHYGDTMPPQCAKEKKSRK